MSAKHIKSKLVRNFGANAYGQLITVAIQLVSVPFYLHFWGVGLYGEWLILSAIPAYLTLSDIGFASVAANDMTMRVAKGDKQGALEVYQSIWIFICIVSTIAGVALVLLIYLFPLNRIFSLSYISNTQTKQLLTVLVMYMLVGLQSGVLSAAFRAVGRYAYGTVINNSIRLAEWILAMIVLVLGGGVLFVAMATFAIRIVGILVMWALIRKQEQWLFLGIRVASLTKIRELFRPAVAFMAFPLGLALTLQGMVIVIGMMLGSTAVVIFSAYRTLTRLVVQIITMLNQAIWPEISSAYGTGKIELIIQIHRKGSSITFWIALAAVTTLGFAGEWIIGVWTRHTFQHDHTLLVLMLITTLLNVLWQTSWVVLMATNKHEKISIVFIASAASALLLSVIAIPVLGINGIGVMLLIAEIPLLLFAIHSALDLLNDKWSDYMKAVISNPLSRGVVIL